MISQTSQGAHARTLMSYVLRFAFQGNPKPRLEERSEKHLAKVVEWQLEPYEQSCS